MKFTQSALTICSILLVNAQLPADLANLAQSVINIANQNNVQFTTVLNLVHSIAQGFDHQPLPTYVPAIIPQFGDGAIPSQQPAQDSGNPQPTSTDNGSTSDSSNGTATDDNNETGPTGNNSPSDSSEDSTDNQDQPTSTDGSSDDQPTSTDIDTTPTDLSDPTVISDSSSKTPTSTDSSSQLPQSSSNQLLATKGALVASVLTVLLTQFI